MHNRKTKYKRHKYICVVCTLFSGYALLKNTYAHFKRARKLIKLRNHNLQDDVLCKPCYHQHIDIRGYQNINTSSIQGSQDSFETCPRCGGTVSTKHISMYIICFIEFIQNFKLLWFFLLGLWGRKSGHKTCSLSQIMLDLLWLQ